MSTMTAMSNKIEVNCIVTGKLEVNTFIITAGNSAVIIDPGGNPERIIPAVERYENILVLLTHCHYDHSGATNDILDALPRAKYYAHAECVREAADKDHNLCQFLMGIDYAVTHKADKALSDHEGFSCGSINMLGIHSTGHSLGHLCYYIPSEHAVFCGDLLTADDVGRHDVPGSNLEAMIKDCTDLLHELPGDSTIYPGHGRSTTVDESLATNPRF